MKYEKIMKKILVIGGNGCGKTTFSISLAEKLKLPLVHLDSIYWQDNWVPSSDEYFDKKLLVELNKNSWIIDGNINRTLNTRLDYCDTVIYMDFPSYKCFFGAIKRTVRNLGKTRADIGGNCPDKIDFPFIFSVLKFNKKYRKKYYALLNSHKNVNIIVLKNRKQVNKFLNNY